MADMKKVSPVGGKALLYFEIVSSFALLIGFLAAHLATPGAGFNVDPATLCTPARRRSRPSSNSCSTLSPTP